MAAPTTTVTATATASLAGLAEGRPPPGRRRRPRPLAAAAHDAARAHPPAVSAAPGLSTVASWPDAGGGRDERERLRTLLRSAWEGCPVGGRDANAADAQFPAPAVPALSSRPLGHPNPHRRDPTPAPLPPAPARLPPPTAPLDVAEALYAARFARAAYGPLLEGGCLRSTGRLRRALGDPRGRARLLRTLEDDAGYVRGVASAAGLVDGGGAGGGGGVGGGGSGGGAGRSSGGGDDPALWAGGGILAARPRASAYRPAWFLLIDAERARLVLTGESGYVVVILWMEGFGGSGVARRRRKEGSASQPQRHLAQQAGCQPGRRHPTPLHPLHPPPLPPPL